MPAHQNERHRTESLGWLRAAVLGANDGIISTASLLVGIAAAHGTREGIIIAGAAGLVAGAMSLDVERKELHDDEAGEHKELTTIYIRRGLEPSLAKQVARQLMVHDALGAHARDELGISETLSARPVQAAFASAGAFAIGAAMPMLTVIWAPMATLIPLVSGCSLAFLALLGGLAAYAGGANLLWGALRVTFWGALAMAATAGVGALFGTTG